MEASPELEARREFDADRSLFERFGLWYFRRRSKGNPARERELPAHVLSQTEREQLRRIQRGTVIRAAISGVVSGGAAAGAEILARPLAREGDLAFGVIPNVTYWTAVGAAVLVVTVFEIGFLYWDSLRSVHRLAEVAGTDLFEEQTPRSVAAALARAALEIPNPRGPLFGIDPYREISRFRMIITAVAYKAKVGLTNALAKALFRRLLGRAALRSWVPFVAIPVTGGWNAYVAWRVMREARVRAMGPSLASELVEAVLPPEPQSLSPVCQLAIFEAAAWCLVRTRDLHPNLAAFTEELLKALALEPPDDIRETGELIEDLRKLSEEERGAVLRTLVAGAVIDGRLPRRERRFVEECFAAAGRSLDPPALRRLERKIVGGRKVERSELELADNKRREGSR